MQGKFCFLCEQLTILRYPCDECKTDFGFLHSITTESIISSWVYVVIMNKEIQLYVLFIKNNFLMINLLIILLIIF